VRLAQNGLLVIETESTQPTGSPTGSWVSEKALPGYTGSAYFRWSGPDTAGPGQGVLRFSFELNEAGPWYLSLHNRHQSPNPNLENSCWVRVDGGAWRHLYSSPTGVWTWDTHEVGSTLPPFFDLTAGGHTLEISAASQNFMLDRLHLYQSWFPQPLLKEHSQSLACPGPSAWDDDWVMLVEQLP